MPYIPPSQRNNVTPATASTPITTNSSYLPPSQRKVQAEQVSITPFAGSTAQASAQPVKPAANPYAYIGQEIIPVTGKESTLSKIGKSIVNYGLGTVGRTVSSVTDLMKQGAYNVGKVATGQKADFSKQLAMSDVFGDKYKAWESKQNPFVKGFVGAASESLLDPTTFVAGGIVDDLARAGLSKLGTFGKAGALGTTENVTTAAAAGQKAFGQTTVGKAMAAAAKAKAAAKRASAALPTQPIKPVTVSDTVRAGITKVSKKPLKPKATNIIPISERSIEDVASKEVKAFQYTNPEVRPFIKNEAQNIMNELKQGVKGNRFATTDEGGDLIWGGIKRFQSKSIDQIQDLTGADYNHVENALQRIIDDKGKENTKLAKQIELVIDDNLTSGAKRLEGFTAPPDPEYIQIKNAIEDVAKSSDIEKAKIERGFSRNARTDLNMADEIRNSITDNPLFYEQLHNVDTLAKADTKMAAGYNEALANWYKNIDSFEAADVPLAHRLANEAVKQGDIKTARIIITDVAEKLTKAGQYSQAANILRKSDPAVFTTFMERQLKKLNEQGAKFYGKKWSDIILTDDEIKAIHASDILGEADREKLMEQIGNRIAKSLPSSGMEKFDAWRRTAMLLNPKTHIRNTVGNAIMMAMRKSADTLNAGLQKAFLKEGDRTASTGWNKNNRIVDLVKDTWETEKKNLQMHTRWDISNIKVLNRDKQVFKGKTLNALDKFTKDTLALEDNIFLKGAYQDALGGYLKANNLNAVTEVAKTYAKRRAFEATFKEAYWLSQKINEAKRLPIAGKLIEGAIPFTTTPVNIAARAFEYSPGGLIKALATANKSTGARIIEDISKGLTGTAAAAAGMLLKKWGFARGAYGTSKIAEGLQSEAGEQPNSIITPWGSYTFDWAQPAAIPLAMGIAIAEALEKNDPSVMGTIIDSVIAGGDTLFNTTMLRNIKDLFGGAGSTTKKLLDIPVSYIEQAIPTILGQAARAIDPVKRSTYATSPVQEELKRIQSKIPFASKLLEPAVDVFGNAQKQGGFIQQFISPGYIEGKADDKVTNELLRLYKANKETDFLPKVLSGQFSKDSVEYNLTPEELTAMKKELGDLVHKQMASLVDSPNYKSRSDEANMKAFQTIVNNTYNNVKAKHIVKAKQAIK